MISTIVPLADIVVCTQSSSPRSCSAETLKDTVAAMEYKKIVFVEADIHQALDVAQHQAAPNDLICVTGSLFTVGEARSFIQTLQISSS